MLAGRALQLSDMPEERPGSVQGLVSVWVSGRLRCASALLGLFNKLLLWNLKAIVNLIAFKIEKLRLF